VSKTRTTIPRRSDGRQLAAKALFWGVVWLLGCTCYDSSEEEVLAETDDGDARLVLRSKTWAGCKSAARFGVPLGFPDLERHFDQWLEVDDGPRAGRYDLWRCGCGEGDSEMKLVRGGNVVLVRCADGDAWDVHYLLDRERSTNGDKSSVCLEDGVEGEPAWPDVPEFNDVAPRLFEQAPDAVVEELVTDGRSPDAAKILAANVTDPGLRWWRIIEHVDEEDIGIVHDALREELRREEPDPLAVKRAATLASTDRQLVIDATERMLVAGRDRESYLGLGPLINRAATSVLVNAQEAGGTADLGPIACELTRRDYCFETCAYVFATTDTACDGLREVALDAVCAVPGVCAGKVCSRETLEEKLVPLPERVPRRRESLARLWQLAAHRRAALLPNLERRLARTRYDYDPPPEPLCHRASNRDAPCRCKRIGPAVCHGSPDDAEFVGGIECRFVIDDEAKTIATYPNTK
jgi:hypothetical protein